MKQTVRCGKNGRDRVTVKVEIPELTVILTSNGVIFPQSLDSAGVSFYRKQVFQIVANNTVNPAAEITNLLHRDGFTVLNPCNTLLFTF